MTALFWAPATSANLGSGFDAVGIALDLGMTARVDPTADGSIDLHIGGAEVPTHDGIAVALRAAIAAAGPRKRGARIVVENAIPLGMGLGSSAAAAALGLLIGEYLGARTLDDAERARLITRLEGHPDNGLATLYGGVVIAVHDAAADIVSSAVFAPPPGIVALVAVPDLVMPTHEARAILPATYPRADVMFTVGRAALLGAALASGRVDLLRAAMADRLHQPYRAAFVPALTELLALEAPGLVGVALSGAGPSVLALVEADAVGIEALLAAAFARHGTAARILRLSLCARGAGQRVSDGVSGKEVASW